MTYYLKSTVIGIITYHGEFYRENFFTVLSCIIIINLDLH
jgi:hypothetical protein